MIAVRVTPRASKDEIVGWRDDGVLLVRLTAPPVEGAANEALCRLIARAVRVAPSRVSVVRGERSRDKVVAVEGMSADSLRAPLTLVSARGGPRGPTRGRGAWERPA